MRRKLSGYGNHASRMRGVRGQFNRRRKDLHYPIGSAVTDGTGNITHRPFTEGLPCFGDPIENIFGKFDEPRTWGDKEPEPRGCAMCPVSMHCNHVVDERLETTPNVRDAYWQWQIVTCALPHADRFTHPTWPPLVEACNQAGWTDDNDRKLQLLEDEKIAEALGKAAAKSAARRERKRKPRKVPKRIQKQIQAYRDDRVAELLEAREDPQAPLWLRNRSKERVILIADGWQARETLDRENKKFSASAVYDWLFDEGRVKGNAPSAIVKRIGEALRKADDLVADGTWPLFDPEGVATEKPFAAGMHPSTVHTLIED